MSVIPLIFAHNNDQDVVVMTVGVSRVQQCLAGYVHVWPADEDAQGKRGVIHKVELCVNGVVMRGCRLRPLHG